MIHAGLPKTGSTAVQHWILDHARTLRERGLTPITDPAGDLTRFEPIDGHRFASTNAFLLAYEQTRKTNGRENAMRDVARQFATAVGAAADEHGDVLVSAEGFGTLLGRRDPIFFGTLDELAARHPVRFVVYLRPQAGALVSRYRQWGFRSELRPTEWANEQIEELDHAAQADWLATTAPRVTFTPRPYVPALLPAGDVVADFAALVGHPDLTGREERANPGISLDLAILLRHAPAEVLATPGDGAMETGRRRLTLAAVTADWELAPSPNAEAATRAFECLVDERLGAGNRRFAARFDWPEDTLNPRMDGATTADLDALLGAEPSPAVETLWFALRDLCLHHEAAARSGA